MAERTGCPVLLSLWSYVSAILLILFICYLTYIVEFDSYKLAASLTVDDDRQIPYTVDCRQISRYHFKDICLVFLGKSITI
jgi:hypothetical protein